MKNKTEFSNSSILKCKYFHVSLLCSDSKINICVVDKKEQHWNNAVFHHFLIDDNKIIMCTSEPNQINVKSVFEN